MVDRFSFGTQCNARRGSGDSTREENRPGGVSGGCKKHMTLSFLVIGVIDNVWFMFNHTLIHTIQTTVFANTPLNPPFALILHEANTDLMKKQPLFTGLFMLFLLPGLSGRHSERMSSSNRILSMNAMSK